MMKIGAAVKAASWGCETGAFQITRDTNLIRPE